MPHLTVNGVQFPGEADSFFEEPEFIGDVTGRSQSGSLVESRTTRKRRWSVRSVFLTATDAEAWRLMLEGDGHQWRLATNAVSSKGQGPSSGGSYSFSSFTPTTGTIGCVTVNAGSSISWALGAVMGPRWTPALGWTAIVLRQDGTTIGDTSSGFYRYMITGAGSYSVGTANPSGLTQWRDYSSGALNVGRWLAMSAAGVLSLHGLGSATGSPSNAHSYAQLTVLPFALPSTWQFDIATQCLNRQTDGLPFLSENPRIVLDGDAIPDDDGANVVARVSTLDQRNVRLAGAHRNNARVITVEFIEV